MLPSINLLRTALSKTVSFIFSAVSKAMPGGAFEVSMPETPDDFTPSLRFMVCSDIHINGEEGQKEPGRFTESVKTAYAYAENEKYSSLDAVCIAGDFTDEGKREQFSTFSSLAENVIKESTKLLICTGNHDYIFSHEKHKNDKSYGSKLFKEMLGRNEDEHHIINGYHFITVSYDSDKESFKGKRKWLDTEISKAVSESCDKPVFVMQHPAPFGTVYGSLNWGDLTISRVLSKYPQVIDFSGHSHYPINDPRSIWQGLFTSLGCGTLSYFETELDYIAGNYPYEYKNAAQFYIVEADKNGNVRILCYDLITQRFFDREYYLTGLKDKNYAYTFNKMKKRDSIPVFEKDAKITTYQNNEGDTILEFDGAKSNFVTESYKVSVRENGSLRQLNYNAPGKYMFLYMDDVYQVNLGKLKSGRNYTVSIIALNAYSQTSEPLRLSFKTK